MKSGTVIEALRERRKDARRKRKEYKGTDLAEYYEGRESAFTFAITVLGG